jgi:DNA-binding transcriptional LysR family regulator
VARGASWVSKSGLKAESATEGSKVLFRQLECFLAVARLGNLSRAAEEMFLTQPTLTARLKALEEEVGDDLFVRTSRGMRLTDAGREFLPYAERVLGSFEEGRRRLQERRGAAGGRLLLGASPGVGTYALPGLLERFVAAYPKVSISVRTGHSEEILDMTLKEEVQLGLTRAMRHPEIESLHLYEDELVLVVDPGHRFTRRGRANLAEIGEEQLIFFDQSSSYFEQTHALLRNAGIRELRTMEVDNIEAAKRMVEHRLGVAFLPRTAVVRSVASGNLSLVSIEERPGMSRSIVALKRRDTPASGPVAAFLEVAETLGEKRGETELSPALTTEFENLQLIDLFT